MLNSVWHNADVSLPRFCRVLQCVAVCCRVLQGVAVCCSVLQCVVVCSALQCVAVCCSVLQCVAGKAQYARQYVAECLCFTNVLHTAGVSQMCCTL